MDRTRLRPAPKFSRDTPLEPLEGDARTWVPISPHSLSSVNPTCEEGHPCVAWHIFSLFPNTSISASTISAISRAIASCDFLTVVS